jgi:hypothetical protein
MARRQDSYNEFSIQFTEALQKVSDSYLDQFDEHAAFAYLVAELFGTTSEDQFAYTDGGKDGGIDFLIRNPPSYEIYQCKCPDADKIGPGMDPCPFADEGLNELLKAVEFLLSTTGTLDVKADIKRLRSQYQRDLHEDADACRLTATLAVAGKLSPPAKTRFEAVKKDYENKGVLFRLIEWTDIARELRAPEESTESVEIDLRVDDPKSELLKHRDYCYLLGYAYDFYRAFQQSEWQLFDWNVRLQLHNSPINKKIVESLKLDRTRKKFHHLNNGVLITCRNYSVKDKTIRVNGAQIINGCQTVRAICDAYDQLDPRQQTTFRDHTRVQVKIIQGVDQEFIGELSVSTNNQNPMNARNLRSNYSEQKELQKAFRDLPEGWFYERKDGEFRSLSSASSKIRWFRKSDYMSGKRVRIIQNEDLAKFWYAMTGNSDKSLIGGQDFFGDEKLYGRVFGVTPSDLFWKRFSSPSFSEPGEDHFDTRMPNPYQYLLAFTLAKLVESQKVPSLRNKEKAIERGIREGQLKGDSSGKVWSPKEEVDRFLAADQEYRLNITISNMREVLIELAAFILVRRYGALSAEVSRALLANTDIKAFVASGFDGSSAPSWEHGTNSVFGPIYLFLKDCVKQFRIANRAEIEAAPRLKTYLSQRTTVTKLRDYVVEQNLLVKDLRVPWKSTDVPFLGSLPELSMTISPLK